MDWPSQRKRSRSTERPERRIEIVPGVVRANR
jgi:hypothetical protein